MNEASKLQIFKDFLKNISHFSNREYQERVWVRAEGPECYDIDEAVLDFLEYGEIILSNPKQFNLSEKQFKLLKQFYELMDDFFDDVLYSPINQILSDSRWIKIMEMAKEVLNVFNVKDI